MVGLLVLRTLFQHQGWDGATTMASTISRPFHQAPSKQSSRTRQGWDAGPSTTPPHWRAFVSMSGYPSLPIPHFEFAFLSLCRATFQSPLTRRLPESSGLDTNIVISLLQCHHRLGRINSLNVHDSNLNPVPDRQQQTGPHPYPNLIRGDAGRGQCDGRIVGLGQRKPDETNQGVEG